MDIKAQTRSAATLAVLAAVFVAGVAWAWSSVTEPFPEPQETPPCYETLVAKGDRVRPGDVLVNVRNAGKTDGLARDTMDALIGKGFGEGIRGNATADTGRGGAVVWASDPKGPAAQLVRSYLGDDVRIIEPVTPDPGITVVVGDRFPGVADGRRAIKAAQESYVCMPPDPAAP